MESNTQERIEISGVVTGFTGGIADRNVIYGFVQPWTARFVARRASAYRTRVNIEGTRKCRVFRYRGRGVTYRTVFRGRNVIRDK